MGCHDQLIRSANNAWDREHAAITAARFTF